MLRQALLKFLAEDSLMTSGSIAYHTLLAIFPLLLLLLGVSGIYIRHFELAGHLSVVLQRYIPVRADIIMQNLVGISRAYGKTGLVSVLLLLWSSSGVFLPLEKALNRAWQVSEARSWWRSRLLALEMAVVVGFLILLSGGFVGVEIVFRPLLGPASAGRAKARSQIADHENASMPATVNGVVLVLEVPVVDQCHEGPQAVPLA